MVRAGKPTYGYEMARLLGIPTNALYGALARLEATELVKSRWERAEPSKMGRPRRRLYRITTKGASVLRNGEER